MLTLVQYYLGKIHKKLAFKMLKNSFVHPQSSVGPGSEFINSKMDKHTYCGYDCRILDTEIGSFCSIANECVIGADTHSISWVSTSPVFNKNKDQIPFKYSHHEFQTRTSVKIGHDVWIGERVIIKSGLNIGTGSVIGAGSIVTKDIPSYEIWGGVPAKFIKKRFETDIADKLLKSEWWKFDDQKLTALAKEIQNPQKFIEKL